jgi:hypothetical protein
MKNINLKKVVLLSIAVFITLSILGGFVVLRVKSQVKDLFRMNKVLQEEGYYMAEFEFKMMGIVYYLDKGQYLKALSTLSNFHSQLTNKENLIKVPEFANAEEEMNFYLDFQNPNTGAFMDDSFPYCTFNEPTENVIIHLDVLAKGMGVSLQLKYPLKYLDEINTPEKLYDFLNDVSYVGWLGSKFPETTFVFARSLLSNFNDEGIIGKNNLYIFSENFKTALTEWFYENQDSITGYWGPRSRDDGQLVKLDLNNTASIIKKFVDKNGNDINESYPLKNKDKMFKTTLDLLKRPLPAEDALDEWHDWNVSTTKGIKMLVRYLWNDASSTDKQIAKSLIENYVKTKFEYFYIPDEGGFSYYPNAEHASLDGTSGIIFKDIGAYSAEQQNRLWGDPKKNIQDLGYHETSDLNSSDLDLIASQSDVNSLRIYHSEPNYANLTNNVISLIYPKQTSVLDIMDLVPRIIRWLDKQSLSIGNWSSKEQINEYYSSLNIKKPLVFKSTSQLDSMNTIFQEQNELQVIAFDILQIPIYKIVYIKSPI